MAGQFLKGQLVNNSENTLQRLLALYMDAELSDIQLIVGTHILNAHKLILSMCSDVFKTMLTDFRWPEAFKEQIVLNEEPECEEVFDDFVKYMYTGHIHLTNHTVLPLLTLADKYNVKDLSDTCVEYMCENCDAAVENIKVMSWLQYARLCSYRKLDRVCAQYIKWNFQKILNSDDFLLVSSGILLEVLGSSDIVIHDEYTLFIGLTKWLCYNRTQNTLSPLVWQCTMEQLMSFVRFPMLTRSQLELLMQNAFVSEFIEFFEDKIQETLHYHDASVNVCHTISGINPDTHIPRNYTCEDWSTQLVVDNFSMLDAYTARTLFFSTPVSSSASDEHECWDWQVDLYPKGVYFPRGIMIGLQENREIEEQEHRRVRLGVMAKSCLTDVRHVNVSVLAIAKGKQKGSEYVRNIVKKRCIFDVDSSLHNLDDIVSYADLQCPNSAYLTGSEQNTFKILIIIKPLVT